MTNALSYRQAPDNRNLAHLPGSYGLPYLGKSWRLIFGLEKLAREHNQRYGEISRIGSLNIHWVLVLGADNWQTILLDKEQNFSTEMGYNINLADFYGGGLLLRDFDEHKIQRRILQKAFKFGALQQYVVAMNPVIQRHINVLQQQKIRSFHPIIKSTLLDVGSKIFMGIEDTATCAQLNNAFADINHGLLSQIRKSIPGLAYRRGMRGKANLHQYFRAEIPRRRLGTGEDMFSYMCQEKLDNGDYFSDDDIIAHAAFLLFAAHDTTTSTLNNLLMLTGINPDWQEKMRAEVLGLGKEALEYADLEKLEMIDRVLHETLRLYPAAPMGTRRTIRNCELGGYSIPANTKLIIPFPFNQRDPRYWSNPETFDPDRFSPERQEHKRHSFCYHPFGGGAHKCIGMHFANMVIKVFMFTFLKQYRYQTPSNYKPLIQWLPLPKPIRLPLNLQKIN